MTRWQRYWFDEGGRYALAIVRIAIAVAVLIALARISTLQVLVAPPGLYRPVGPWMLLGDAPPPGVVIDALWWLALVATMAMLVGAATRLATAISFVAAVSLAAISFSGSATWSHQYNVVFLAQLAFLGARGGDVLSLDALIRAARGLPPIDLPRAYQWSLRLVQLAVALMFAGAMFYKLLHGHFTLRWALSDNLRHQLLMRYDLAGLDRPAIVDWILADVWRYRTVAMLNLITQGSPILAVVFARRPWVRAAAGAMFLIEVVALDVVVSLWNPAWLPLAAVFVDWDALIGWFARRRGDAAPTIPLTPPNWRPRRAPQSFVLAFVGYELITSFIPTLDQRLNTFPFSGFPMFARLRIQRPYDEHRPFAVAADHFEALDRPIHDHAQRWLDSHHRGTFKERDHGRLRRRLELILGKVPARYPELDLRGLRHYLAIFEVPAYPAPARFARHLVGVTGELAADGTFRSVMGSMTMTPRGTTVVLAPQNVDTTDVRLAYYRDDHPEPIEISGTRTGNTFALPRLEGHPLYVVAIIGDTPWLVATRP